MHDQEIHTEVNFKCACVRGCVCARVWVCVGGCVWVHGCMHAGARMFVYTCARGRVYVCIYMYTYSLSSHLCMQTQSVPSYTHCPIYVLSVQYNVLRLSK